MAENFNNGDGSKASDIDVECLRADLVVGRGKLVAGYHLVATPEDMDRMMKAIDQLRGKIAKLEVTNARLEEMIKTSKEVLRVVHIHDQSGAI